MSTATVAERASLIAGLRAHPPHIAPRYFYDAAGSRLFDRITATPEYYPTRTELAILREQGDAIGRRIQPGAVIIELGSGSGEKILTLLNHLPSPLLYRPIDISRAALDATCAAISRAAPHLALSPFEGDFTAEAAYADLPSLVPRLLYYSGSTIGNLAPLERVALLRALRGRLSSKDALLLAVDLVKDPKVLHDAYNDRAGVTAAFNRNILRHINARFGATFDPESFDHVAFYEPKQRRVEMHLVPRSTQRVTLGGEELTFSPSMPIHTESSYKFTKEDIVTMARASDFMLEELVTDERAWFAAALLRA